MEIPQVAGKAGVQSSSGGGGDIPASPAVDTEAMVVQDCALWEGKRVNGERREVEELPACVRVMYSIHLQSAWQTASGNSHKADLARG